MTITSSPFAKGFDCLCVYNGKLYVTRNNQYIRYSDPIGRVLDSGFPYPIDAEFWGALPADFYAGLDSMMVFENNDLVISKGSQYVYYVGNKSNPPRPIAGNWKKLPVLFQDGFDSMARLPNGDVYITKGDQYARGYFDTPDDYTFRYQKPISRHWGLDGVQGAEAFLSGFDAMTTIGKNTYVFRGDQYVRYSDNAAEEVDWGFPRSIEGNFGCPALGDYRTASSIELLDVWGEGRIIRSDQKMVTGFTQAFNLNHRDKKVGDSGDNAIPNLVPIDDYMNPRFPVSSGVVKNITVMGSPISPGTAREMVRVISNPEGRFILYDLDSAAINAFEAVALPAGFRVAGDQSTLTPPYSDIQLRPGQKVRVYKNNRDGT